MSNYDDAFDNRIDNFIYAQKTYPHVMKYEFKTPIDLCSVKSGDTFVNIPADIAFKTELLPKDIMYIPFDFNKKFADILNCNLCSVEFIPLKDESADIIMSMAGLHHFTAEDRLKFYRECRRILQPNGTFILGEVLKGSKQDKWLNEYVNKYNSNGHEGMFFTIEEKKLLEEVRFEVEIIHKNYPWVFDSIESMCDYCINLFGLNLVNHDTILEDIQKYLNYIINEDGSCQFEWSLIFFKSTVSQV